MFKKEYLFVIIAFLLVMTVSISHGYAVSEETKGKIWKEDFNRLGEGPNRTAPEGWKRQGKPGTPPAKFSIKKNILNGDSFLHMVADKASASIREHLKNC